MAQAVQKVGAVQAKAQSATAKPAAQPSSQSLKQKFDVAKANATRPASTRAGVIGSVSTTPKQASGSNGPALSAASRSTQTPPPNNFAPTAAADVQKIQQAYDARDAAGWNALTRGGGNPQYIIDAIKAQGNFTQTRTDAKNDMINYLGAAEPDLQNKARRADIISAIAPPGYLSIPDSDTRPDSEARRLMMQDLLEVSPG